MLEDLDARRSAAGANRYVAELALPAFAAAILTIFVLPNAHGAERVAAVAVALALAVHSAVSAMKTQRAAEREQEMTAAMTDAVEAIEGASRATATVLGVLNDAAIPAVDKSISLAEAMTSDRRLSASVRGRAATIRTQGEAALAVLRGIAEPPPAEIVATSAEPGPETPAADPAWAIAARPLDGLRALVAESNGAHQLILRGQLAQFGIEAEIVSDGVEAIETWRSGGWDLLLLDLQMPRLDGLEAARMIRSVETRFGWAGTPIIGLAPSLSARLKDDCADAGMSGCVGKPIDGEDLFAAIEAALAVPAHFAADLPVRMARAA
jgi:CheY-like chemotaxis protein